MLPPVRALLYSEGSLLRGVRVEASQVSVESNGCQGTTPRSRGVDVDGVEEVAGSVELGAAGAGDTYARRAPPAICYPASGAIVFTSFVGSSQEPTGGVLKMNITSTCPAHRNIHRAEIYI